MARFLVIAASSAIGQATTVLLRSLGHDVLTTARDTSRIQPDAVLDATPMTNALVRDAASRKVSEGMHALGRIGTPEDAARAIVFLLESANAWITGQVIGVDGGLANVRPKVRM